MVAQDQSVYTRNYQARIIKNGVDAKCRMCAQYDETVNHLLSGCPAICFTEYKNRRDRVVTNITKPHTIKTGMNINLNLLLKQTALQSFGISQYIKIEKLRPINLTLQLKIRKTTPVY